MSGRGSGSPVLDEVACCVLAPRSGWQCYLTSVLESSPAVEVALVPFRIPPLLGFDPSSYLAGLFQQLRYLLGKAHHEDSAFVGDHWEVLVDDAGEFVCCIPCATAGCVSAWVSIVGLSLGRTEHFPRSYLFVPPRQWIILHPRICPLVQVRLWVELEV